ncbi:MAG: hypothetical protein K2Z81_11715 [Cyanobacteria bacterium]|nr:hypothetical protein [Cyanobacteriota bacterium]
MHSLTEIYLGDIDLTGLDLSVLQKLPNLHSVDLANSSIDEKTLISLGRIKTLHSISLCGVSGIQPIAIDHLTNLPLLVRLDLSSTIFGRNSLDYLHKLPALKCLLLNHVGVRDSDLSRLAKLSLKELSLEENPISERGMSSLASMSTLSLLSLLSCRELLPVDVESLQKKLPGCKIKSELLTRQ